MPPVKLEAKETVFAMTDAIMTVLRYSTNHAFVSTTLAHLKVNTLEEAEFRLGQHLWSILHRHLDVELPPEVAQSLSSLPLLPPPSPSRTCTTRGESDPGEDTTSLGLLLCLDEARDQLFFPLPLFGELHDPIPAPDQGEDPALLRQGHTCPPAAPAPGPEPQHDAGGAPRPAHIDIESLSEQVVPGGVARESPAEEHQGSDRRAAPLASPRGDKAAAKPSSPCPHNAFLHTQNTNTEAHLLEPCAADVVNDDAPATAQDSVERAPSLPSQPAQQREDFAFHTSRIEAALLSLSASLVLGPHAQPCYLTPPSLSQSSSAASEMPIPEATTSAVESDNTPNAVKNRVLEALSLLSGSLLVDAPLHCLSQTPSSLSQGSPLLQRLAGLSQEREGLGGEPRKPEESLEQLGEREWRKHFINTLWPSSGQAAPGMMPRGHQHTGEVVGLASTLSLPLRCEQRPPAGESIISSVRGGATVCPGEPRGMEDAKQTSTSPVTCDAFGGGKTSVMCGGSSRTNTIDHTPVSNLFENYSLLDVAGRPRVPDHQDAVNETPENSDHAKRTGEPGEHSLPAESPGTPAGPPLTGTQPSRESWPHTRTHSAVGKGKAHPHKLLPVTHTAPPPSPRHASSSSHPRKKRKRAKPSKHPLLTHKRNRFSKPKGAADSSGSMAGGGHRGGEGQLSPPLLHETQTDITLSQSASPRASQVLPQSLPLPAQLPPQPVQPPPPPPDSTTGEEEVIQVPGHQLHPHRHYHCQRHHSSTDGRQPTTYNLSESPCARSDDARLFVAQDDAENKQDSGWHYSDGGRDDDDGHYDSQSLLEGVTLDPLFVPLGSQFPQEDGSEPPQHPPKKNPLGSNTPTDVKGVVGSDIPPRGTTTEGGAAETEENMLSAFSSEKTKTLTC